MEDEQLFGLIGDVKISPAFFTAEQKVEAVLLFLLWMGFEGYAGYSYAMNPDDSGNPGACFLIGSIGMVIYTYRIGFWFPNMEESVDEKKVSRFVRGQIWLRRICAGMNFILTLTPLWCFLFADRFFELMGLTGDELRDAAEAYDSNGWTMGAVTFFGILNLMYFILMCVDRFGSEDSIFDRVIFLRERVGQLEDEEIKRRKAIRLKSDMIEVKKKEIAELEKEIMLLERKMEEV